MREVKNNPNVHEVELQAGGMATNQWLISALQTPFSGSLSQDQKGLILNNQSGDTAFYANVMGQNNKPASEMFAGNNSTMYFDTKSGQNLDYFTGTNYSKNAVDQDIEDKLTHGLEQGKV